MLASSSLRVLKRSISAVSPSVGSTGRGRTRPKAAVALQSTSSRASDPFPARLQFPRRRLEVVHGELVQQIGIVEPDPPLVLLGEQVAVDLAARRLVSLEADETRDGGRGRNPVLGQQALDLPGAGPVALLAHRLPDRALARLIRGDGEGHQCVQIDFARR